MIPLNTEAYVNQGRWVALCPACETGLHLARGVRTVSKRFIWRGGECSGCAYPLILVWPEAADLIDEILAQRPLPVNRNWWPHETAEDLLAENDTYLRVS